jgi:hypothetical protein
VGIPISLPEYGKQLLDLNEAVSGLIMTWKKAPPGVQAEGR